MNEQPLTVVERQAVAFQEILRAHRRHHEDPVHVSEVIDAIAEPLLRDYPQLADMVGQRTH